MPNPETCSISHIVYYFFCYSLHSYRPSITSNTHTYNYIYVHIHVYAYIFYDFFFGELAK